MVGAKKEEQGPESHPQRAGERPRAGGGETSKRQQHSADS